ncbi:MULTISPECIES: hypothetical protein [Mycolicibacter]|nr:MULTISPECIES: hypothetical protein [Mycolicibacter]
MNSFVGEPDDSRDTWTIDQLQAAYDSLDQIGDQVVQTIKMAIGE